MVGNVEAATHTPDGVRLTRRTFLSAGAPIIAGAVAGSRRARGATLDVPILLRVSDAVSPGDIFSVNGEGMDADNIAVLVAHSTGAAPPLSSAVAADVIQTDAAGRFVVARLPKEMRAGAFHVWVRNAAGYSIPIAANRPRPLFLSEYEAWAGQEIELVGRNFDPREFGAQGTPQVRLVDDNQRFTITSITRFNPFAITIRVPGIALAKYRLQVSTDGQQWWPVPEEETLTVVPAGGDPLGLGVAWAGHFQWDRVFDVTRYGVPTNSASDVTAQVQAVVATAKQAGGGVVYFPAGRYQLSRIQLPADVILQGAGAKATTLVSTAKSSTFISSTDDGIIRGHHGVARLRIEIQDADTRPDVFISLGERGQNNSTNDITARTASEVFVTDVQLNYPLTAPSATSGQRGIGLLWIAKERALCSGCQFIGYQAQPFLAFVTNYYTVKRNYFEYATGSITDVGSRCFYEDNHIVGRRDYSVANGDFNLHGLFARDRAYIANNVVEGVGSLNLAADDGEAICVEAPNGSFNYGNVTAADANTLTVNPVRPLTVPLISFGRLTVAIIDGRGLSQLRSVTRVDPANNQLTVDRAWEVIPDATSAFTLFLPLDQVTFHRNRAIDCTKGMWLYGNTFDGVMADNTSTDSEGFYIHTVRTSSQSGGVFQPGYFDRITRNRVTGVSPMSKHGGISYSTGRFDLKGAYFGTMAYGIEMRSNFISGSPGVNPVYGSSEAPPYVGLAASAATYSSQYDGNPAGADGKNTIMTGNALVDLAVGINLTHSLYGTMIADNSYTSTVATFVADAGSIKTDLVGNTQLSASAIAPFILTDGRGIINGGSYLPGNVVSGSWISIKGTGFTDQTTDWSSFDFSTGLLPTMLNGVQVLFNGTPGAIWCLIAGTPQQINVQAPANLSGNVSVQVSRNGVPGNTVMATAVTVAPAIFCYTLDGGQTFYPSAVFPDGTLLGDPAVFPGGRQAKAGDTLILFANSLAPSPAGVVTVSGSTHTVTVTIGSLTFLADFAGLVAPGDFQINFTVPKLATSGNYPILLHIDGQSSQTGVIFPYTI